MKQDGNKWTDGNLKENLYLKSRNDTCNLNELE